MRKRSAFLPFIGFIGLVTLFSLPLLEGKDPSRVPSALVGKTIPAFTLPPALDGGGGLSDAVLKADGRAKLVNVFSSWCVTCGQEQQLLARIAATDHIDVYGIDYKDDRAKAAAWLERHGNPYKDIGFDAEGRTAIDFGVYGVPETFVIGGDGTILYRFPGALTDEDYRRSIRPLLMEGAK